MPTKQCDHFNWVGHDVCKHRTTMECPHCGRAFCGTHRHRHKFGGHATDDASRAHWLRRTGCAA